MASIVECHVIHQSIILFPYIYILRLTMEEQAQHGEHGEGAPTDASPQVLRCNAHTRVKAAVYDRDEAAAPLLLQRPTACMQCTRTPCLLRITADLHGSHCSGISQLCRTQARAAQGEVMKAAQELQMKGMMYVAGAMTVNLIGLGDELGLYAALKAGSGPMTSTDLAKATGTHERWTREWLYQQVASAVNMRILWRTCAAL